MAADEVIAEDHAWFEIVDDVDVYEELHPFPCRCGFEVNGKSPPAKSGLAAESVHSERVGMGSVSV